MKELQRTYHSPICKRNGSTGDLLSQTDSLDGMDFINYFVKLTNLKNVVFILLTGPYCNNF